MKELITIREEVDNLSKQELVDLGAQVAMNAMESGQESPLRLHIRAKRVLEFVTSIFNTTRVEAHIECMNYPEKTVRLWNCDVTEVKGGDILDYEQDITYANLKAALAERKALLDLKFKYPDKELFDDDGAAVPVVKVKSTRRDSLHLKF